MNQRVIGIVSGGQLALMTALAAGRLGVRVVLYCKSADECATAAVWKTVIGDYKDKAKLAEFAAMVDDITCDWESVPAETLEYLESLGKRLYPKASVFAVARDRLFEKQEAHNAGMATAKYAAFSTDTELANACERVGFPAIIKTRCEGYDGKGQRKVATLDGAIAAWAELKRVPCVLERVVDFECEASVIVCRARSGRMTYFPAVRNEHEDGMLRRTIYGPNAFGGPTGWRRMAEGPMAIMQRLGAVGIVAFELFVLADGSVIFNEMAPRPHNSGHWTIDGCSISQFEMLVRLMLSDAKIVQPESPYRRVEMTNLLGAEAEGALENFSEPDAFLHLYGKELRIGDPRRKRGHITRLFR